MLNFDTFLPAFLFITRFAESYSAGTYGSGGYSETGTTSSDQSTSSPIQPSTPSATDTQASETPVASGDQPVNLNNSSPRTTTSQPATRQDDATPESVSILGMDPITITYSALITLAVLVTIGVLIVKKIARQ